MLLIGDGIKMPAAAAKAKCLEQHGVLMVASFCILVCYATSFAEGDGTVVSEVADAKWLAQSGMLVVASLHCMLCILLILDRKPQY